MAGKGEGWLPATRFGRLLKRAAAAAAAAAKRRCRRRPASRPFLSPHEQNTHTAIVVFGASGAVGSALVDLLATRPRDFGLPSNSHLRVVAAAPDAVSTLGGKYGVPSGDGGGGGGGEAAGNGGGKKSSGGGGGGGAVEVVPLDVDARDAAAVRRALDLAQDRGHALLGVASCMAGGGGYHCAPLSEQSGDEVADRVAREVLPAANVLKCSAHALAGGIHPDPTSALASPKAFRASIVVVGAAVARRGFKHHEAFAACKGAVEAMTLSAAATLAQSGVRVNVVAPGLVRSPASAAQSMAEPAASKSAALYPPHRLAEPEEVAAAVAVALSPALLPFTTGAVLPVDGGLTSVMTYEAPTVHV